MECQRAQGGRGVCGASEEEGESMWCVRGHMEDWGGGVRRCKSMETRNYFEKTLHMPKI